MCALALHSVDRNAFFFLTATVSTLLESEGILASPHNFKRAVCGSYFKHIICKIANC